jgi:hypothetical protein
MELPLLDPKNHYHYRKVWYWGCSPSQLHPVYTITQHLYQKINLIFIHLLLVLPNYLFPWSSAIRIVWNWPFVPCGLRDSSTQAKQIAIGWVELHGRLRLLDTVTRPTLLSECTAHAHSQKMLTSTQFSWQYMWPKLSELTDETRRGHLRSLGGGGGCILYVKKFLHYVRVVQCVVCIVSFIGRKCVLHDLIRWQVTCRLCASLVTGIENCEEW